MGPIRLVSSPRLAALRARPLPALALIGTCGPSTAEMFLNGLETPSFLLDSMMSITCSNAGGQRLLADNIDFLSRGGRLCTGSAKATDLLAAAVARVALQGGSSWQAHQLRLQCSPKSAAFNLGLTRWVPGVEQGGSSGVRVLMIAYSACQPAGDPIEQFGLTTAEARVARDLIAGVSPKAIALQQGRSLTTIRTHLARLMVKTETNRQSDLVLALTRGARDDGLHC